MNILDETNHIDDRKLTLKESLKNISPKTLFKSLKVTDKTKRQSSSSKKDKFQKFAKRKDVRKSPLDSKITVGLDSKIKNELAKNKFNSEFEVTNLEEPKNKTRKTSSSVSARVLQTCNNVNINISLIHYSKH